MIPPPSAENPRLIRRACGGWLAVSRPENAIRIGVCAPSEEQARADYAGTMARWRELLASYAQEDVR